MTRPKGSKNKPKDLGGNPEFNLKDAQPVAPGWQDIAPAAITEEDLALDRELEMIARNSEPANISDQDPGPQLKKTTEPFTLLSEFITNYKPAKTINELDDQVFKAKHFECDSIEATPEIVKYFCKKDYPDKVGYFVYHDIKVYIAGFFEESIKRDRQTIEQRNFGASKII